MSKSDLYLDTRYPLSHNLINKKPNLSLLSKHPFSHPFEHLSHRQTSNLSISPILGGPRDPGKPSVAFVSPSEHVADYGGIDAGGGAVGHTARERVKCLG